MAYKTKAMQEQEFVEQVLSVGGVKNVVAWMKEEKNIGILT